MYVVTIKLYWLLLVGNFFLKLNVVFQPISLYIGYNYISAMAEVFAKSGWYFVYISFKVAELPYE